MQQAVDEGEDVAELAHKKRQLRQKRADRKSSAADIPADLQVFDEDMIVEGDLGYEGLLPNTDLQASSDSGCESQDEEEATGLEPHASDDDDDTSGQSESESSSTSMSPQSSSRKRKR